MRFLKNLAINLGLLFIIGIVLFIAFPGLMTGIFQLYGGLFGSLAIPIILILVVVKALPSRRSGR